MKTILFILISFLELSQLQAQSLYVHGEITKGKNASYYCIQENRYRLNLINTNNKDTTFTMYYNDGSMVPEDADLVASSLNSYEELYKALQSVLTDEEWTTLKKLNTGLFIRVVADNQGNTTEISFSFNPSDPVMTKMAPDRLFILETKLKEIIKIIPDSMVSSVRNFKYSKPIMYSELP